MPRTLSSTEYKELGRRYYGRKEYQSALDAFTEGIEAASSVDITLYDYRSSTWMKLDKSQAALADGRHMIKAEKTDPRGYLRTGKILEQLEKLDTALSIYNYGLKNVPVSNPQQKLLKAAHDRLNRKLSPPAAVDPFTQLPLEIAEMILGYLKFYELINSLRVSRHWKAILTSMPNIWNDMDLFRANKQKAVRPSSVISLIKYSQCKIKRARIHMFSDHRGLRSLATTCKALQELDFGQTQFGGDTIIETAMMAKALKTLKISEAIPLSLDQITQVLRHRPTLANLQVDHVKPPRDTADWKVDLPVLTSINFTLRLPPARLQDPYLDLLNLTTLFDRAPNLKSVHLDGWKSLFAPDINFSLLESLETLSLHRTYVSRPPLLPRSLKNLIMNDILSPIAHVQNWAFTGPLPALERAFLDGQAFPFSRIAYMLDGNFEDDRAAWITFRPKNFKALGIYGPQAEKPHHVMPETAIELKELLLNERISEIEELTLYNLWDSDCCINDDIIKDIAEMPTLRKLRHLDLTGTAITGVSIKKLVTSLRPTLETLIVSDCQISPDAIDWARKQNITVIDRSTKGPDGKSGRRVFYG